MASLVWLSRNRPNGVKRFHWPALCEILHIQWPDVTRWSLARCPLIWQWAAKPGSIGERSWLMKSYQPCSWYGHVAAIEPHGHAAEVWGPTDCSGNKLSGNSALLLWFKRKKWPSSRHYWISLYHGWEGSSSLHFHWPANTQRPITFDDVLTWSLSAFICKSENSF